MLQDRLNTLLSQWQERINILSTDPSYKDAVRDCMYDLKTLIEGDTATENETLNPFDYLPPEEVLDMWLSQEADSTLASMKDYGTA